MDRPTPDLSGYREAQIALIENLGTTVPFFIPTDVEWPPGVPLDPQTNTPFDPAIDPIASGFSSAAVKCGVVLRPIGLSRHGVDDDSSTVALGILEEGDGVLLVPKDSYEQNDIADATRAEVHGETYEITQTDSDGIGEAEHRMLVHIRQL